MRRSSPSHSNNTMPMTDPSCGGGDGDDDEIISASADQSSLGSSMHSFAHGESDSASTQSSFNNSSSTSGNPYFKSMQGGMAVPPEAVFAPLEEKLVSRSRMLVFFVLGIAAVVVGMSTYRYLIREELQKFEQEFYNYATEILEEIQTKGNTMQHSLHTMSTMATTLASVMQHTTWPFLYLENFESWATIDGSNYENNNNNNSSVVSMGMLVKRGQENIWNGYSSRNVHEWLPTTLPLQNNDDNEIIIPYIWKYQQNLQTGEYEQIQVTQFEDIYSVLWQTTHLSNAAQTVNFDLGSIPEIKSTINSMIQTRMPLLSTIVLSEQDSEQTIYQSFTTAPSSTSNQQQSSSSSSTNHSIKPISFVFQPIFDTLSSTSDVVAFLQLQLSWKSFFENVLPEGANGIQVVVSNICDQTITIQLNGPNVQIQSINGDLHDTNYNEFEIVSPLFTSAKIGAITSANNDETLASSSSSSSSSMSCNEYSMSIYPSNEFRDLYDEFPLFFTIMAVLTIFCTALVFVIYDWFVQMRQRKVVKSAHRSQTIVNSLFPENVRDRLLEPENEESRAFVIGGGGDGSGIGGMADRTAALLGVNSMKPSFRVPEAASRLIQYTDNPNNSSKGNNENNDNIDNSNKREPKHELSFKNKKRSKPIADLFPNTTVLFADMVGFTAWSSVREPSQVFTLLETLFNAFDKAALKRNVFKVETIGDCYMAVTGLPEPRKDHALVMAKFARECTSKMMDIFQSLEVELGPGTGDLSMRFGLHSGPVTAGVLRGEKSRFQLFGDTVNTAARIETTGAKNRVHLSQETADLIIAAGKSNWIKPRESMVSAKGKGKLQTYWLETKRKDVSTHEASLTNINDEELFGNNSDASLGVGNIVARFEKAEKLNLLSESTRRLVNYNVEVLQRFLKRMVAARSGHVRHGKAVMEAELNIQNRKSNTITVLDEIKEIITLPRKPVNFIQNPDSVTLKPQVTQQLREYVTAIATKYRENNFHSFDHASHVAMSVTKLLSRVITPDSIDYKDMSYKQKAPVQHHEYTYGITSDPLTQFACAYAALIHDVDHSGVPNSQLIKEKEELAQRYKMKSVAEQHSVDTAWGLLMQDEYRDLRECIYTNEYELDRFRQLVVNAVMATDLFDKDLAQERLTRWDKAFAFDKRFIKPGDKKNNNDNNGTSSSSKNGTANRKATVVIEHLIQASDIAHTMQHWHVYLKWNKRLFRESFDAFKSGRRESHPADSWYEDELTFFDHYVLPLAMKLKECGVFGVAGEEYLNYAKANRKEWVNKGESIVKELSTQYKISKRTPTGSSNSVSSGGSLFSLASNRFGNGSRRSSNDSFVSSASSSGISSNMD